MFWLYWLMTWQVSVDSQRMTFESQLRDKVRELNEYQAKYDAHSAEMKARYNHNNNNNNNLLRHSLHAPASVSLFKCTVFCRVFQILVDIPSETW